MLDEEHNSNRTTQSARDRDIVNLKKAYIGWLAQYTLEPFPEPLPVRSVCDIYTYYGDLASILWC